MFTTNIHATEFEAARYEVRSGVFATIKMTDGTTSKAEVFLETPEKCDEAIRAFAAAKSILLGETSEPVPVPATEPPVTNATRELPTCLSPKPGTSTTCQRPAGHAGGHKNYAKDDYWPQEDAEDEPRCEADFSGAGSPQCLKAQDHTGPHVDETGRRWVFGAQPAGTDAS